MLDVAWPELVVIGAVALVAIGPKDLPKAMRVLGQWAGKARGIMHDLQRNFEQLTYEAEIAEKLKNAPPVSDPPAEAASTPPPQTPEAKRERSGH